MIKPDERNERILTFIDNGYSGGNIQRDGFLDMMRQIEHGEIKKVIVYRLDRISRSLSDFVGILEILKHNHVQFVSSQESFDTSSTYGEMIVKLLMVFAEFERQSIIERVTQAYSHRSEKGFYMGGRAPYGFSLAETEIYGIKTKMLVPVYEEIEQITYIFKSYAVGGVSIRSVIDNMLSNGMIPTEGSWSTGKISTILKNPVYVRADNDIYEYFLQKNANIIDEAVSFDRIHGIQLYGQTKHTAEDWSDIKVVVMQHEGVIASDVWLACQRKLSQNKQIGNSLSNTTSWLGGLVHCKQCGRTMSVTKGGKHSDGSRTRYFSCTGKTHNRICKGPSVTLYAESLENALYSFVSEKLKALKTKRKQKNREINEQLNSLKNRLSEISKAQDKLVTILLSDSIDSDMIRLLNDRAKKLNDESEDINSRISEIHAKEADNQNNTDFESAWQTADYETRKAVCRVLIDRINISENGAAEIIWNI